MLPRVAPAPIQRVAPAPILQVSTTSPIPIDDHVYEVDHVVNHRMGKGIRKGHIEYRIRWKGYPPDQDTWELAADSFSEAIQEHMQSSTPLAAPHTFLEYSGYKPRLRPRAPPP